jgi:pimeloyl-ACP methyl ester carboxylesterase
VDHVALGRFPAQCERPEPLKFAWPIVLIPELFTTPRHLALLFGYLASIGWEVIVPDLRDAVGKGSTHPLSELRFDDLAALAGEAIDAIGRDAIVIGHGVGGLVALKLSANRRVKAAVAYAPLVPGFRTPLVGGFANRLAMILRRPIKPPRGRILWELIADSDSFTRDALMNEMVPDSAAIAADVMAGAIEFAPSGKAAPRLIVAGASDIFAPLAPTTKFAESIGARLATIAGRGHWLIGGRALERAINETQRFLVRALGQDLLLLYPEEWKDEQSD